MSILFLNIFRRECSMDFFRILSQYFSRSPFVQSKPLLLPLRHIFLVCALFRWRWLILLIKYKFTLLPTGWFSWRWKWQSPGRKAVTPSSLQLLRGIKFRISGILGCLTLNLPRRQDVSQEYDLRVTIYFRAKPSNLLFLSSLINFYLNQEKFFCLIFKSFHLRYASAFFGLFHTVSSYSPLQSHHFLMFNTHIVFQSLGSLTLYHMGYSLFLLHSSGPR